MKPEQMNKEYVELLDQCKTIEELQKLDFELQVKIETNEAALKEVQNKIWALEETKKGHESFKSVFNHIRLLMKDLAYWRFVAKDEDWEPSGEWRTWYE